MGGYYKWIFSLADRHDENIRLIKREIIGTHYAEFTTEGFKTLLDTIKSLPLKVRIQPLMQMICTSC